MRQETFLHTKESLQRKKKTATFGNCQMFRKKIKAEIKNEEKRGHLALLPNYPPILNRTQNPSLGSVFLLIESISIRLLNTLLNTSTMQVGTFLIRFSDSELGGVTVAWISSEQILNDNISSQLIMNPYCYSPYR